MLKDIIEKIENSEIISSDLFENFKKYSKSISVYFNIDISDIKIVEVNVSNAIQYNIVNVDYTDFYDIIYNNDLMNDYEYGYVACHTLEQVI